MALKLVQSGREPLGQYDGLDTEVLTLKGGEICTFTSVAATSSTDKAAADVFADGYLNPANVSKRVVVTRTVASTVRPLFLCDEGITGYGTLLGAVVGGTAGQQVNGPLTTQVTGAVLGPHTATGSGKVTLWGAPGTYSVSLDAVDQGVATAPSQTDGLQPTNSTLVPGQSLTWVPNNTSGTGGYLTPVGSTNAAGNTVVVARFIDFETNGSLVTTPNKLVAALNSPSGIVTSVGPLSLQYASFWFSPPMI
jgi:hypothetical protein